MPDRIKKLAVRWHKQEKGYYCGEACLQMVLGFFHVRRTQNQLYADVVANSTGTRPPEAPCNPNHACYPTQVCDLCGSWECWDTDPDALTATLNQRAPRGTKFELQYVGEFEAGTRLLIESIGRSRGVPAVVTVESFNHWVVINGFHLEDEKHLEAESSDEHPPVNGVYILDPLEARRRQRLRLVPISEWRERFGLVDCSPPEHLDDYIVITGSVADKPKRRRRRGPS